MSIIRVKITRSGSPDKGKIIRLDIEEYLRGVVPSEIPASSGAAALRAQSIAARTYAVQKIKARAGQPYDVDDTTAYQAYKQGYSDPRTDQAIRDTAGQVLHHGGKIVDTAVYCASNGGKIKSSKEHGWNHRDYLTAKDDPYTKRSGVAKDGHGVGMSQRGAMQMAKEGCSCEQILAFYYPGTVIVTESASAPKARPTLRVGERGEAVKELQTILGVKADGIYGEITKGAVIAFQIQHALKPDGICGPLTWAALGVKP